MATNTLPREIYEQQRDTWSPIEDALFDDYSDFTGRQNRIIEAGTDTAAAFERSAIETGREMARYGALDPEAQKFLDRTNQLALTKGVGMARGIARQSEEARRQAAIAGLVQAGSSKLGQGMDALALSDAMRRQREAAEAEARRRQRGGIGAMAGMAIGAGLGSFFGPMGTMAGAQLGGSIGGQFY